MVVDLVAGQVKVGFVTTAGMMDHVQAGRLKGLGVAHASRSPLAPDVPTIAESGYPGFRVENYNVMLAPAGIPEPIATLLEREVQAALKLPDVIERFAPMDTTPAGIIGRRSFGADQGRPGGMGKGRRGGQHADRMKARITLFAPHRHLRSGPYPMIQHTHRTGGRERIDSRGHARNRHAASRPGSLRAGHRHRRQ